MIDMIIGLGAGVLVAAVALLVIFGMFGAVVFAVHWAERRGLL